MRPYVLVSPVHNEGDTLEETIAAVAGQTHPPREWIVVDDASTDTSSDILALAAQKYDWLTVISLPSGPRGNWRYSAVVREGLSRIRPGDDHVALLDGDTVPHIDCFERLSDLLDGHPHLGVVGGRIISRTPDGLKEETVQTRRPRGGIRMWGRACFDETGGYDDEPAPDSISNLKAVAAGYGIAMGDGFGEQARPTGGRTRRLRYAWGRGRIRHYLGMRLRTVAWLSVRQALRGHFLAGLAHLASYLWCVARRRPRIEDPVVRGFFAIGGGDV